ncbi:MAG: 50S ribosomal protein L7Ae-like protein [Bacillota bacterium]|nr:MAG: 50S ribosomal protein L7Ae-like protein [Bacillota bacterium]
MPERPVKARSRAVGARQTLKAIEKGTAEVVFVARDAEARVVKPVEDLARRNGTEIVYVDNMRELGKYCSINVGAAAAAVLGGRAVR